MDAQLVLTVGPSHLKCTPVDVIPLVARMDEFVGQIRKLCQEKKYGEAVDCMRKSFDVLRKNAGQVDAALELFDPEKHTLGVLAVLFAKTQFPSIGDPRQFLSQVETLVNTCDDEQVKYARDAFVGIIHKATDILVEQKRAMAGIPLLVLAANKAAPANHLSSVHADLCQLCLLAKCVKPALPFLDAEVKELCDEGGGTFEVKDFLRYYYYGGMIYTALKRFDRALFFFEVAVTTPAATISAIMLESYKKHLLVSLLLEGKQAPFPRYTSQVVYRYLRPLSQPYHELSSAFGKHSTEEMKRVITKHQTVFANDQNTGLVNQCLSALYRKNIQRLTKTFITLSLADIAARVNLESARAAEMHLLQMIEDNEIFATIDQAAGMVRFHDNPERYNDMRFARELDAQIQQCVALHAQLASMDRAIAKDPRFVQKQVGRERELAAGAGDEAAIVAQQIGMGVVVRTEEIQ